MTTRTRVLGLVGSGILMVCGAVRAAEAETEPSIVGRWDLTLEEGQQRLPSWLGVTMKDGQLHGRYVSTGGGVHDVQDLKFENGRVSFRRGDEKQVAELKGNELVGEITRKDGSTIKFTGKRFVPKPERPRRRLQWGEPIKLFNGKDLDGWETFGQPNNWKAENGELVNTGHGANIRTKEKFWDFKLHIEFCSPEGGNSGVYLRGRYEIQVCDDSKAAEPSLHGCGSLYSRIAPSKKVTKKPGEWQTFDITIIGQRLTLVFNGETVIDNAEIEGITGGALDSDETQPGPIYLQGDHTGMKYRNIELTPLKAPNQRAMDKEGPGERSGRRGRK